MAEIRSKYPEVPHRNTEQVRTALAAAEPPIVLDTRRADEFAVSHLAGARNVPSGSDLVAALGTTPKDRRILVYCSVGYRSAAAARVLRAAGFTAVENYLGSIFAWANDGLPLIGPDGPTRQVHPYDSHWGELLRPELRAR
ncbi:MAG: rhodanese-like domain-containing protein [Planctomycetes bacterium]|nr:rhodanese-like domain-containing protein [Planctomycetota bacterium]